MSPEVLVVGLIPRNTSGDTDVSGQSVYAKTLGNIRLVDDMTSIIEFKVERVTIRASEDQLLRAEFDCRLRGREFSVVAQEASPEDMEVSREVIPLVVALSRDTLESLCLPQVADVKSSHIQQDGLLSQISGVECVLDESLRLACPRYSRDGVERTPVLFIEPTEPPTISR